MGARELKRRDVLPIRHRALRPGRLLLRAALIAALPTFAFTSELQLFRAVARTDVAAAGVGGLQNTGRGTIRLTGVSGTVREAFLYWSGPTQLSDPMANARLTVNGIW